MAMTRFIERNQIVRAVTACLPTLDMVDIQNRVPGFALAPLTAVGVSCQHIFPDIPETELWPFLVGFAFDGRVLQLLKIKLSHLNDGPTNGQEPMNHLNGFQMRVYPMLNGRGQPPFRLASVQKTCWPVPCFSVSPDTTKLLTSGKPLLNIHTWLHFSLKQHRVFRHQCPGTPLVCSHCCHRAVAE